MDQLGRRIRKERKASGLTLEALAKIVGSSRATLQRIETGVKSPSVALLSQISNVLRKPIDELIREERKAFYRLEDSARKVIETSDFSMSTICPFGLLSRDIVINHFVAEEGAVVKPHTDKGYEWVYLLEGTCVFDYDGTRHELGKADAVFYDARKPHSVFVTSHLESIDLFLRV